MNYLNRIESPADVKSLKMDELVVLSDEIRVALLRKLSDHGGHIGPNLGMVEATVALHYVFDSPEDKIVFDVSHQSYAHKMLTGRKEGFLDAAHYEDVSGYSEPGESEHDHFVIGHTSTSVSLACGLAKGRDLAGGTENVIAVIGDGSLSGGEALEGLDFAAELNSNLIIVVNDNQMSIAENHGGLYRNLSQLRATGGRCECNLFRAMGLDYVYVDEGNDVARLVEAFRSVKDTKRPVVVHINTVKGKGYRPAEERKEHFHWGMPFDLETGETKPAYRGGPSWHDLTVAALLAEMRLDPKVVAITAGTPAVMGFTPEKRAEAGSRFVDVGIAEEHAVALASGIAKRGGKPVFGVYSTFIQRAYDQISQDLCINGNPAVMLVFLGTLTGMNDVTHLGFFDIPLLANIPGLVYLAPTCREEYLSMLRWSVHQSGFPVAIRVPSCPLDYAPALSLPAGYGDVDKYEVVRRGSRVAVLALGGFFGLGEQVCGLLAARTGIVPTLVNPRYATGVDRALLEELKAGHDVVVTLEDGVLDGGWGEKIARYYGPTPMRVLNCGARKAFADRYDYARFLSENRLTAEQIVEDVESLLD